MTRERSSARHHPRERRPSASIAFGAPDPAHATLAAGKILVFWAIERSNPSGSEKMPDDPGTPSRRGAAARGAALTHEQHPVPDRRDADPALKGLSDAHADWCRGTPGRITAAFEARILLDRRGCLLPAVRLGGEGHGAGGSVARTPDNARRGLSGPERIETTRRPDRDGAAMNDRKGQTPPILSDRHHDAPSAFTPESLLPEASGTSGTGARLDRARLKDAVREPANRSFQAPGTPAHRRRNISRRFRQVLLRSA